MNNDYIEKNLKHIESIEMPNGYCLFVYEDTLVGGRVYFSDEIGGGVEVWQTALVDRTTVSFALAHELWLSTKEAMDKYDSRQKRKRAEEI